MFQLDQLRIGLGSKSRLQVSRLELQEHERIVVVKVDQRENIVGDFTRSEHDLKAKDLRRVRLTIVGFVLMTKGGVRGSIARPRLLVVGEIVRGGLLRTGRTTSARLADALRLVEIGIAGAMVGLTRQLLAS